MEVAPFTKFVPLTVIGTESPGKPKLGLTLLNCGVPTIPIVSVLLVPWGDDTASVRTPGAALAATVIVAVRGLVPGIDGGVTPAPEITPLLPRIGRSHPRICAVVLVPVAKTAGLVESRIGSGTLS